MKPLTPLFCLALSLLLCACTEQPPATAAPPQNPGEAAQAVVKPSEETLGEVVYKNTCAACHDSGVGGAPKIGDREAWQSHGHHGMEHMFEAVRDGKGAMPPRGGNPELTDAELRAAIEYILEQSR